MSDIRVRFAPSPTGPLHIGGVRTALYNYLFAKKHNGTFILRIEDTDQTRFVEGAEDYIINALKWLGMDPEEGPQIGGKYGPYKQSERKQLYIEHADILVKKGLAYYAFDTVEELDQRRDASENDSFKYNYLTRGGLRNSISLSKNEVDELIANNTPYTIRLKVPQDQTIEIKDEIRSIVRFQSNELDDKILIKGDGLPTYHLANIVDDHLMEITHVIRGEEWLSSTAHHVLLYDCFGWTPPIFAHLPLILKPVGQGKLSKRDGAKFGFPVFPLDWNDVASGALFPGFKEIGFMPEALTNFLAFLGWNPGNDEEMFSMDQLIEAFSIDKISKSGARFDFEKAKWYNQQYIIKESNKALATKLLPHAIEKGLNVTEEKLAILASMMKERVYFLNDIIDNAMYLFETPTEVDEKTFKKKYKPENKIHFQNIADLLDKTNDASRENIEFSVKDYINDNELSFGRILPILRIALTGTMKGPDLFDTIAFLGKEVSRDRILNAVNFEYNA